MPFRTDLEQAGQRAALRPVPAAPPLAQLQLDANKHKSQRRMVVGTVAALLVVLVAVPLAFGVRSGSSVQTIAVTSAAEADAGSDESVNFQPGAATAQDDEQQEQESSTQGRSFDDFSMSVRVLTGSEAAAAAAAAESAATETRDIDGQTVWIARDGDVVTVSALVDDDKFLEVQGDAEHLDRLLDALANQNFDRFGLHGGNTEDFGFFFDLDENGDFGKLDEFRERFENGDFGKLEEFFNDFEGRFDNFDGDLDFDFDFDLDDFEGRLPNLDEFENFDFEQFFEGGSFRGKFEGFGDGADGCISINLEGDETLTFEYPEGCAGN